nr:PREDICTED: uncharacterized protein LOC108201045 isoform X2 [Daucus carota subsp. sativus]
MFPLNTFVPQIGFHILPPSSNLHPAHCGIWWSQQAATTHLTSKTLLLHQGFASSKGKLGVEDLFKTLQIMKKMLQDQWKEKLKGFFEDFPDTGFKEMVFFVRNKTRILRKMTECNTDTPTEHVLPLEDADVRKPPCSRDNLVAFVGATLGA